FCARDAWRRDREPDRRLPVTAQGAAVMSETQDIGIDALRQLALNLRWSWGRATDELWAQLDPELWALTHNPLAVLQAASPRRVITADGSQEALYPYNDPDQLPITPVRSQSGDLLRLPVELPGYKVWLRAWQVQVGRVVLYLLDSNDPANPPAVRGITSELYG